MKEKLDVKRTKQPAQKDGLLEWCPLSVHPVSKLLTYLKTHDTH